MNERSRQYKECQSKQHYHRSIIIVHCLHCSTHLRLKDPSLVGIERKHTSAYDAPFSMIVEIIVHKIVHVRGHVSPMEISYANVQNAGSYLGAIVLRNSHLLGLRHVRDGEGRKASRWSTDGRHGTSQVRVVRSVTVQYKPWLRSCDLVTQPPSTCMHQKGFDSIRRRIEDIQLVRNYRRSDRRSNSFEMSSTSPAMPISSQTTQKSMHTLNDTGLDRI